MTPVDPLTIQGMSGLRAFGGVVEAVFLDVGGVFHLPDPEIVGPALHRAGVAGPLDLAVLDRAHYAGAKALEIWSGKTAPMKIMRAALVKNVYGK